MLPPNERAARYLRGGAEGFVPSYATGHWPARGMIDLATPVLCNDTEDKRLLLLKTCPKLKTL